MRRTRVADVMTTPAIGIPETATYHDIVETLVKHNISALPIVDGRGCVVGVVSEADLLPKMQLAGRVVAHPLLERRRARHGRRKAAANLAAELMSHPAIVIRPSASIAEAATLMSRHEVKRLPVVDDVGNLLGVVSRSDLVRLYSRPDDQILSDIREHVLRRTLSMDPDLLTIEVTDGVVSLTGTVARRSTVDVVELLVQTVPGVVDVANHLTYRFDDRRPLMVA